MKSTSRRQFLSFIFFLYLFSCTQVTAENKKNRIPAVNRNLESAIANMYGYARYFNPNKQLSKLNWDKFLMYALRESQYIPENKDSIRIFLEKTFRPLIPDMQLTKESQSPPVQSVLTKKNNSGKAWFYRHYGFGSQKLYTGKDNFYSKIVYEEGNDQTPAIDSLYSYKILNDLYLHYPIAVSEQNKQYNKELKNLIKTIDTIDIRITKYPFIKVLYKSFRAPKNTNDLYGSYMPIFHQDKSLFKANLIERWNIIKHFYPYLKEEGFTDEKMNQLLLTYLNKIDENITNEFAEENLKERFVSFFYILKEFMANFRDGHAIEYTNITGNSKMMVTYLSVSQHPLIALDFIEDTIVSRFDLEGKNINTGDTGIIKRGDRLVSVNSIPVDSLLSMKLKYITSSNDITRKDRFLTDGFSTEKKDSVFRFVFESSTGDHIEFDNNVADRSWGKILKTYTKKNKFINNLGNGIYYIALSSDSLKEKTFSDFISSHSNSIKALIFELREYPAPEAADILPHLSADSIRWGNYKLPTRYFPNQEYVIWTGDEMMPAKQPSLKNIPCYALIDKNAVSYGESIVNTLKKNKLATLVGTNTSGTNGDMSHIDLHDISMFDFVMTVGKDLDGYHSVGVSPDIQVKQTLEDYRKGKDTVFEYVKKLLE